jgi:four helix bundle protein
MESILHTKSYAFALKIVKLYRYLVEEKKEYVLSKQILRSGTSIWANIEESFGWQSKKDWLAKLSIAYKEARETRYWLSLLKDSGYISGETIWEVMNECEEICKIIWKIRKTTNAY